MEGERNEGTTTTTIIATTNAVVIIEYVSKMSREFNLPQDQPVQTITARRKKRKKKIKKIPENRNE